MPPPLVYGVTLTTLCRVILLAALTSIWVGCTDTRYSESDCGGTPFPHPISLVEDGPLSSLAFFRSTVGRSVGEPTSEIWADSKYEYDAALTYRYVQVGVDVDFCLQAIALQLRHPLDEMRTQAGLGYVSLLEEHFGVDMAVVRQALMERAHDQVLYAPWVKNLGSITAEINGVYHPIRGEFMVVSYFLSDYYQDIPR